MKFTEARLEEVFTELLANEGYPHHLGETIRRAPEEVLIEEDLITFLLQQYKAEGCSFSKPSSLISNSVRSSQSLFIINGNIKYF